MSATQIHPTAVVDPGARLGEGVQVGPYAIIGKDVQLGDGCIVAGHALIEGPSIIGRDNHFHSFCSVGSAPQDKSWKGEPTRLEMGDGNMVREYVTINRGTMKQEGLTKVGSHNWIMACSHIAHDCRLGDNITMANTVNLAGHVVVDDWVTFGGYAGVHQYCKVGAHAMIGPACTVLQDVPTYVLTMGSPAEPRSINAEGLRRRGFSAGQIDAIKRAYRCLYRSGLSFDEAKAEIARMSEADEDGRVLKDLSDFLARVARGIIR